MATQARLITAEQLWKMPGDQRRELVRGELRTMAPAGSEHGAIINNLAFLLTAHVRNDGLGVVFGAETGFVLARNPDVVRGADVAFVRADRIPAAGIPKKFWEGPPDLAVEVLSPSDLLDETEEKIDDYLGASTSLVWLVNPRRRTITIYRPGEKPRMLGKDDSLSGEDVIPGFNCQVAEAFV